MTTSLHLHWRVSLLVMVLFSSSFQSSTGKPEDAVQRLYLAAADENCDRVGMVLSRDLRKQFLSPPDGCEHFLERLNEKKLERIVSVAGDGRNPQAQLVRVRVVSQKMVIIFRVEIEEGVWRITSL